MVTWGEWQYRTVEADLTVGDIGDQPDYWATGVRSIEATVETLLALNLETLTGLPLRLVRRSDQLDPSTDIVATDALGRVHLFELKKGSFSGQAAAQLNQYLLQHVFADADQFLSKASRRGVEQADPVWLARYITGVWANHNGPGTGYKKIIRELGKDHPLVVYDGRPLSGYRYKRLGEAGKLGYVHPALASHGAGQGLTVPALDQIMPVALYWSRRLRESASPPKSSLVAERRLVLWLVGANISSTAIEEVRRWRRSGVDARVLRAEGRSSGSNWTIRTRREDAPQRDRAETELLVRASEGAARPATVKAVFYEERSPSEHSRHGGGLLDHPIISVIRETS